MISAPDIIQPATASARARGSSFEAAMRILPRARREAMLEIYSFCRAVDDIADEGGPHEAQRQALGLWRRAIDDLYRQPALLPRSPAPLEGLAQAIRAFGLRQEDFHAVIDGMQMDVETIIRAPGLASLDVYCDRVASAVGRLSACAFGMPDADGRELAHHLGRALQLTNVLRDLDEDASRGRLYLPREDLLAAGIEGDEPQMVLASPALGLACAPVIARAREHFAKAREIMSRCPRASVKAPKIMADVYRGILNALEKRGFAPPRAKTRAPRLRILLAILRHGLF